MDSPRSIIFLNDLNTTVSPYSKVVDHVVSRYAAFNARTSCVYVRDPRATSADGALKHFGAPFSPLIPRSRVPTGAPVLQRST